jgi:hypothetical protein
LPFIHFQQHRVLLYLFFRVRVALPKNRTMNALYLLAALTATLNWHNPAEILTGKKDTVAKKYHLQYDRTVLRNPGQSLPIGIVTRTAGGSATKTKGFLKGDDGWGKYKIEVQGGSYSNGKIKIAKTSQYLKGDSLTVSVYTRKWFLGGKDKWLLTKKIPYNYEDSISILTTGNIGRAPGDHVQFGIRTWYDNKQFADKWAPAKKNLKGFVFQFDGSHLSKSKSDVKIDGDPEKIKDDKVQLVAMLAKDSLIRDTLRIMLDYIANYQCNIASAGNGHSLSVTANLDVDSVIHSSLLEIAVFDSTAKKSYRYKVNTNGGSIAILSKGANGLDGRDGFDGTSGSSGSDGSISVDVETVTNPDGTTSTTTNTVEGPGGDGGNGGDGENGQDGDNGGNGGNIYIRYTPAVSPFLGLIKALSLPGAGGSGGRGGEGGSGGSGGSGNPPGNSGIRGMSGNSGSDGAPGAPGKVVFIPS